MEADAGFTVAIDPTIDPELRAEGIARELVNRIQTTRREAGLEVSDRIRLGIYGPAEVLEAARALRERIARETLAVDLDLGSEPPAGRYAVVRDVQVDRLAVRIALSVALAAPPRGRPAGGRGKWSCR